MSEYAVVYERTVDGGWAAFAPDLPGVVASADSRAEAERRMAEAIQIHLNELAARGRAVPEPSAEVGTVIA